MAKKKKRTAPADTDEPVSETPTALQSTYRLLYEPAILIYNLNPCRGRDALLEHIHGPGVDDGGPCRLRDLMRSFLNCVSYLCDWHPGGESVTAAALATIPGNNGPVVVLAGNTTISTLSVDQLRGLFLHLGRCAKEIHDPKNSSREEVWLAIKLEVLRSLTLIGKTRLRYYQKRAQKALELVETAMKNAGEDPRQLNLLDILTISK